MMRLFVVVEGPTEEAFVTDLLYDLLFPKGIWPIPILVATNSKKQPARGGWNSYAAAKKDVLRLFRQHQGDDIRFTTMLDLYALPDDFPGYADRTLYTDPYQRVGYLEDQFAEDIGEWRLIPYLQLHEYEALLFSDITKLAAAYPSIRWPISELVKIPDGYESPEHINDGPTTAPSKQILGKLPRYDKVTAGTITALEIGLQTMRAKCRHFDDWLTALEGLSDQ